MSIENKTGQPRFMPVLILALCAMAVLKAANFWVDFTGANAEQIGVNETPSKNIDMGMDLPPPTITDAPAITIAPGPSERRILEQLAGRRVGLDAREEDIDTREKLLEAAELRLDQRLAEMNRQRGELAAMSAERNRADQEELGALSSTYERMKARDAARIFDALDRDILVPVAAGMRTQSLAGVLAEMKPEKARALTRELAGRARLDAAIRAGPQ